MLLVLVSLAVATLVTAAYLASRDNSGEIGENASCAATSRAAALSMLEIGIAILETESDWRTSHTNGRLVADYALGEAEVDLDLIDLATRQPPSDTTYLVELTATATVRGLTQVARAIATVADDGDSDTVDVDLSEFAVFGTAGVSLHNNATLTQWPMSPIASTGQRRNVGTRSDFMSAISINDDAAMIDTSAYAGPVASANLINNATGPEVQLTQLLDKIPVPEVPTAIQGEPATGLPDETLNATTLTVSADAEYNSITLGNGAELRIADGVNIAVRDDLTLQTGSTIVVEGSATLSIYGEMNLDNSSFLLEDGANVAMWVKGSMLVNDGYVGDGPTTDRDVTGGARWMNPERVRLYKIFNMWPSTWRLQGSSVMKSLVYAPSLTSFSVRDQSAFYGAVTAFGVNARNDAAIFYEPLLNEHKGYTEPDSGLFDTDGRLLTDVATLASLNSADLQTLADDIGQDVTNTDSMIVSTTRTPKAPTPAQPVTPRPVLVTYTIHQVGADRSTWE